MTNSHTVIVQNFSTVLTDDEVKNAIPAFQYQVSYHFKPYWNIGAVIHYMDKTSKPPTTAWVIGIFDDSDQAGALGYHDMTSGGMPIGKVFAATDKKYGLSWTVTFSHELLELLADPWVSSAWQTSNTNFHALEVGDPVEADELGYTITVTGYPPILVSDFICPAWFGGPSGRYDYKQHCTQPLQVLPGGYVSIFVSGKGWTQYQNFKGQMKEVQLEKDNPRFRDRG